MDWLNYHHLLYFWVVAREGSIVKACEQLQLAQPTVSAQLQKLERSLGARLFERTGRKMQLTETGQTVFRYAEEIFALGKELTDVLHQRPVGQPLRFTVGVPDVLPKMVVYRLLRPAFELPEPLRLVCREGRFDELLSDLATHDLDLVLSDSPAPPNVRVKVYNHSLGRCGVGFFGSPDLVAKSRHKTLAEIVEQLPLLMPTSVSQFRRNLDQWFDANDLRPRIAAEFADSALLKVFGQEGRGLFPAPLAIRQEVERQYNVQLIAEVPTLTERYFAISVERRLKHPAVLAISTAARNVLT
ncbi:MAG: transcriptional activator NhaR [Pirellulales bacterium]